MKDETSKQKGLPFSTSRSQERANKKNTRKARRQSQKAIDWAAEQEAYRKVDEAIWQWEGRNG